MEIPTLKISAEERKLLSDFIGEDLGDEIDFNRLMPVVEKIQKLGYGFTLKVLPIQETIAMYYHALESRNRHSKGKLIENVYRATVVFIKWYNSEAKGTV